MTRGNVGEVQHQWGFEGVVWVSCGGNGSPFFQIACRVERGGFGASEWGRGALLLLGCGG